MKGGRGPVLGMSKENKLATRKQYKSQPVIFQSQLWHRVPGFHVLLWPVLDSKCCRRLEKGRVCVCGLDSWVKLTKEKD